MMQRNKCSTIKEITSAQVNAEDALYMADQMDFLMKTLSLGKTTRHPESETL